MVWPGLALPGLVWPCVALPVVVWPGLALLGMVWPGLSLHGVRHADDSSSIQTLLFFFAKNYQTFISKMCSERSKRVPEGS